MPRHYHPLLLSSILMAIGISIAMAGCAPHSIDDTAHPYTQPLNQSPTATAAPAPVRQGRYALVELGPTDAQRDLLLQVVDISVPSGLVATVGDAVGYVLLHSGYRLCAPTAQTAVLLSLPIPAAHRHLGPMSLRDALATLSGRAWILQVDELSREVCFVERLSTATAEPGGGTQ